MQTIHVAEYYPHYSGHTSVAMFDVTMAELKSLLTTPYTGDNSLALQDCLEARAGRIVYFTYDLFDTHQIKTVIDRLVRGKSATLIAEEGVIGFSLKDAHHALKAAMKKDAEFEAAW